MDRLVNGNGQVRQGLFDEPVAEINYQDFDWRSPMDRKHPRWRRYWGFNQFQFVSAQGPDWLAALAIVNLKLVSNCFFYLYDFREGRLYEHSLLQPLALGTRIDTDPEQGRSCFRKGSTEATIDVANGARRVRLHSGKAIEFDLALTQDATWHPLRLCSRAGYNGWVYTQKWAGLPVSGHIRWGERQWQAGDAHRASVDWSCGFMRRETAWNWACLAGRLDDGTPVGLNLALGVNESGMTENALWWNGQLIKLDQARFDFQRYQPDAPWRVTTSDGAVDLRFQPAATRAERVNALILASNFRQLCGTFDGQLRGPDGRLHVVRGLRGLVEDHYARW